MGHGMHIPDQVHIDRELIKRLGLPEFVRQGWDVLEPGNPLIWGWHLDAISDPLEAVVRGDVRRLAIAVPPGSMKSLMSSVFLPAYIWGPVGRASWRALFASYSGTLSTRDSVRCRRLIESRWYQDRWGVSAVQHGVPEAETFALATDQNAKTKFENNRTGIRTAASVGGTVTGDRGNAVVCDDLLDRKRAESDAHRAEASEFFWETLPSRVNNLERDAFIVIAQRLHTDDTIGEILKRAPERWEKLIIPMEFEPKTRCVTGIGFTDPRTDDGELLEPKRIGRETIENLKADLGTYAYAGQYQQRPAPRGGGMVKEAWIKRFRERGANPRYVIQSWDTASKPAEKNDPSACGTFAVFDDHVELWHVDVKRREFPDLVRRAKDLYASTEARGPKPPTAVLVEDKDSGQQLIQMLRADTRMPVIAINPGTLDKVTRLDAETPSIEAGKLWVPADAPWVAHYIDEITTFPMSSHKDQVDMTSQALKWIREKGGSGRIPGMVSVTRAAPGPE